MNRCRYSAYGLETLKPSKPDKQGIVRFTFSRDGRRRANVTWDGNKTETVFSANFIETVPHGDNLPPPIQTNEVAKSPRIYRRKTDRKLWGDDQTKRLAELATEGLTASKIGAALGFSRSAVIGKIARDKIYWNCLGRTFPNKPRPASPRKSQPPRPIHQPPKLPRGRVDVLRASFEEALEATELPPEDVTNGVPFFERRAGQCRWPLTNPTPIFDFRYCGQSQIPGYPYCAGHCRMAYRLPGERRERRAA